MSSSCVRGKGAALALVLGCGVGLVSIRAADGGLAGTAGPATRPEPAVARAAALMPPSPPPPDNPVHKFRELLALNPEARNQALAAKSEWQQRYLRERLAEFDALPATEQEVRLGLMQLRFHLLALVRLAPTNRAERLSFVPADDRELILNRVAAWDRLPAEQQKELLQNEAVLTQLAGLEATSPARREAILQTWSPGRRQEFESDLTRWHGLPEPQRQRIERNFNEFFELSERQKQKALHRVADTERDRVERTMAALEKLPPAERARCLEALNRYTEMTPEERTRFLQNAARWQAMSAEERQAWRLVAARLTSGRIGVPRPPIPPPLLPPRPRGAVPVPTSATTNAQVAR